MSLEKRDHGDEDFKKGDFDPEELKKILASDRTIDDFVLEELKADKNDLADISEKQLLKTFNLLLNAQNLYAKVDTGSLNLKKDVLVLVGPVHEAQSSGKTVKNEIIRKLNRAILFAVYVKPTARQREMDRIETPDLMGADVSLSPLPPLFGDPVKAILKNLSGKGMGILCRERITPGVKMVLLAVFPDRTRLETKIEVKYAKTHQGQHLHGLEFLEIPQFRVEKFNKMAIDSGACDDRIRKGDSQPCHLDCSYYNLCQKPEKNLEPSAS